MTFFSKRSKIVWLIAALFLFQGVFASAEVSYLPSLLTSDNFEEADSHHYMSSGSCIVTADCDDTYADTDDCDNCCHCHGSHLTLLPKPVMTSTAVSFSAPQAYETKEITKIPTSIYRPPIV
jgi:hypothetical protein